jgi:hypothetical protein
MDIPVCDLKCQKEKQLKGLYDIMESSKNNPVAYEKARLQYYTLKDGQGWLAKEKEKKAKEEIEAKVQSINAKYDSLKSKLVTVPTQEPGIHIDDKVAVAERLSQFTPTSMSSWFSIFLDVIIACLGLFICYSLFNRMRPSPSLIPVS